MWRGSVDEHFGSSVYTPRHDVAEYILRDAQCRDYCLHVAAGTLLHYDFSAPTLSCSWYGDVQHSKKRVVLVGATLLHVRFNAVSFWV